MHSTAPTVKEYLDSLPESRRQEVNRVRSVIRKNLPDGYKEGMDYGMISYFIPLEDFPDTYNGHPLCYVALASQKSYMSLYLLSAYSSQKEEKQFRDLYAKSGKKLDMGKSCVRFKKADDLALDVIAKVIASKTPEEFVDLYQKSRPKK